MIKSRWLAHLRAELRTRFERLATAALEAHAAATDPDSKAEGKFDTRSLVASYLAAGQARQVDELAKRRMPQVVRQTIRFATKSGSMKSPSSSGPSVRPFSQ